MRRIFTVLMLVVSAAIAQADLLPLKSGQKIVFLGDSITQGGTWVEYVDFIFRTRFPDAKVDVIPLGLSSETVCGLTEEGHPFPRPNVHDRLDSVIDKIQPDVIVACYGMNDGNYKELSPERMKAFTDGITLLIKRCESRGVRVVLVTPPPFDPVAKKGRLSKAGHWESHNPYEGYNDVLAAYGRWEMSELTRKGYVVGDANGRTMRFLEDVRRHGDPDFVLAKDGIHPGPLGHWLIAQSLLSAWTIPQPKVEITSYTGVVAGISRVTGGNFIAQIPLPRDPRWNQPVDLSFMDDYHFLQVPNVDGGVLFEGETALGPVTADECAKGFDLTRFDKLSTVQRGTEMLKLVQKMHAILRPAWLSYVGHNRPGVKPGLPIDEALKQAAVIDKQLRELAKPMKVTLTVQPVK